MGSETPGERTPGRSTTPRRLSRLPHSLRPRTVPGESRGVKLLPPTFRHPSNRRPRSPRSRSNLPLSRLLCDNRLWCRHCLGCLLFSSASPKPPQLSKYAGAPCRLRTICGHATAVPVLVLAVPSFRVLLEAVTERSPTDALTMLGASGEAKDLAVPSSARLRSCSLLACTLCPNF